MANLTDFFVEYQNKLNEALQKGKLKEILELWVDFIEMNAKKTETKVSALDELFGWE